MRAPGVAAALVGLAVLVGGAALAVVTATPAAAAPVSGSTSLVDDGAGRGLVDASERIVPGTPLERCTTVSVRGGSTREGVRLSVQDVTGALASHLRVRVEVGTGGSRRSCEGFSGTQVYDGTLGSMADATARGGLDTGWRATPGDPRTFRFTFTLTESAPQADSARGDFVWTGTADDAAPPAGAAPADHPSPGSAPVGEESPLAPSEPPPVEAPAPGASPPVVDGSSPAGTSAAPQRAEEAAADVVLDSSWRDRWRDSVDLSRAPEALAALAASPGIPVAVLAAVLAFLLVQHHLDANDPKLALAPARSAHARFTHPLDGDEPAHPSAHRRGDRP